MFNDGNKKENKLENNELLEAMKEVGREMARTIKMTKSIEEKIFDKDDSVEVEKKQPRKSILDIVLPENYEQIEKKNRQMNQVNNDSVNVVMMGKRPTICPDQFANLFDDDNESFKKLKNSANKSFYERKIEGIQKKEKKLEMLRNIKKEEELKHTKMKPKMNKTSQKIMEKKKNEIKPIHQRVNEIVDKKYLKIDRLKQIYRDIENTQCSKVFSNAQFDEKKFEEWLARQMRWEYDKKSKIEIVKEENERLETTIMRSMYHPIIDRNSEAMAKSKVLCSEQSSKNKEDTVYDKLYNMKDEKYNKLVKRLIDSIPTFTPTINKHVPTYLYKNTTNSTVNNVKIVNNPVATDFSRYNQIINEKDRSKARKHYKSVEDRNKIDVIYEENYDEEPNMPGSYGIYVSNHNNTNMKGLNTSYGNEITNKGKGVNTSMVDKYNNPIRNNESDNESPEETDLIAKYRNALLGNKITNNQPIKTNEKIKKSQPLKEDSKEIMREQPMQKIDLFDQNHFKNNIRNALAFEKDKAILTLNSQQGGSKTMFLGK